MDYMARLEALDSKLEREGLTEAEQAEIELLYYKALLSVRDYNIGSNIKIVKRYVAERV